jgi:hypothetical protein
VLAACAGRGRWAFNLLQFGHTKAARQQACMLWRFVPRRSHMLIAIQASRGDVMCVWTMAGGDKCFALAEQNGKLLTG